MDEKKNATETPAAETGESRKKWKPVVHACLVANFFGLFF